VFLSVNESSQKGADVGPTENSQLQQGSNKLIIPRIVEVKHASGQKLSSTTIVREYPQNFGPGREPYYPVPAPDAKTLYSKYADRAASERNVSFVGRLATYRYYNMDQVVGMALAEFERLQSSGSRGASVSP
jgi:UDP-galactopyranose mutase